MEEREIFIGTEIKLNINIEPIGKLTMEDYDFSIEIYTQFSQKKVVIPKSAAKQVDANNYIIMFNSAELGSGNVMCKITAEIPDGDFADRTRTEVVVLQTGLIVKPV